MPTLSFDKPTIVGDVTVRVAGGAFTPLSVRGQAGSKPCGQPQALTKSLVVAGDPDPEAPITLSKFGGADWLTLPATATHGEAFEVELDGSGLKPGFYAETITAQVDGYDAGECLVELRVDPMG